MGIWEIAFIIAGAAGVGFFANYLSGGAISTIIAEILDVVKTMVSFLLDNMPRPIKMAVFLILFVALGGVLYQYTVGAQYICLDDQVNKVAITEGLAANFWPPDLSEDPDIERARTQGVNLSLQAAESIGDWAIRVAPLAFGGYTVVPDSELRSSEEMLYEKKGDTIQTIDFDRVVYAVVSEGDLINQFWLNMIFKQDKIDLFRAWMGEDEDTLKAVYEVCQDVRTNTCTMQRLDLSSWSQYVDAATIGGDSRDEGCPGFGPYSRTVGRMEYTYEEGTLFADFHKTELFGPNPTSSDEPTAGSLCTKATREDREQDEPIYQDILGTNEDRFEPISVYVRYNGIFGDSTRRSGYLDIYAANRVPVFVEGADVPYFNKQYPLDDSRTPSSELRDLFDDAQPVENKEGDIVTFACREDTENQFDTVMYLGGIDVFDPKLMFLFVILSFIWGFYKSMDVL